MNQQKKLDREQLKIQVLSSIWRNPVGRYYTDMMAFIFKMSELDMQEVLDELMRDSLLIRAKKRYHLTDEGIDRVVVAQSDSRLLVNSKEWKNEALTGIYTKRCGQFVVSEQSEIEKAVIPKKC